MTRILYIICFLVFTLLVAGIAELWEKPQEKIHKDTTRLRDTFIMVEDTIYLDSFQGETLFLKTWYKPHDKHVQYMDIPKDSHPYQKLKSIRLK